MGVAIISVEDEAAQASREFRCEIKLLMQHMQLLAADLSHEEGAPTAGHDVQVTHQLLCCALCLTCTHLALLLLSTHSHMHIHHATTDTGQVRHRHVCVADGPRESRGRQQRFFSFFTQEAPA